MLPDLPTALYLLQTWHSEADRQCIAASHLDTISQQLCQSARRLRRRRRQRDFQPLQSQQGYKGPEATQDQHQLTNR